MSKINNQAEREAHSGACYKNILILSHYWHHKTLPHHYYYSHYLQTKVKCVYCVFIRD